MNLCGRNVKDYFSVMKIPLLLNFAISLFGFGLSVVSAVLGVVTGPVGVCLGAVTGLGLTIIGLIVSIVSAFYVGYSMAKSRKATLVQAAVAGALFGFLVGVFEAVVNLAGGIINLSSVVGTLGLSIVISVIGLFIGPVISTVIGCVCGIAGGVLAGAKQKTVF
jgi:hypothetical protein